MMFWAFVFIRVLMAFLSWGYFVPDETWQSVEVAHKLVFGNGHLTWEWEHGLRSYLHPALFAILFKILKFVNLDTPFLVTIGPKILQAILSAICDTTAIKMFPILMSNSKEKLWIYIALYSSNWFLLYASSRTLINTIETCLTNVALNFFVSKDTRYVGIIALCFMMRPTTAIFWLPMVAFDILGTIHILRQPILQVLSTFVRKMLPQALIIPSVVILFDSYFYGKLTIVPWNFVKFNIINNISEQYGIEPWHWYLTNFLPSLTLGIGIYPVIKGMYKTFASSSGNSLMPKVTLVSALWTLFVYSSLKHKEHRFLLPLVPLLLAYMAVGFPKIRSTSLKLFCGANVVLAMYLSMVHQTGPNAALAYLSSNCKNSTGILILTPCHGTPFYSHLHWKVPMKFLQCPPDLGDNPKDENKQFVENPLKWLQSEVNLSEFDQIVFFDKWDVPPLQNYLAKNGLEICEKFWHTHIPDSNTSPNLLLYCRQH